MRRTRRRGTPRRRPVFRLRRRRPSRRRRATGLRRSAGPIGYRL